MKTVKVLKSKPKKAAGIPAKKSVNMAALYGK
jgi:hypothetical protein